MLRWLLYFDKLSTLQTCQFTCNFHKNSSSNPAELEPVTSINNSQEYHKLTDSGKVQLNKSRELLNNAILPNSSSGLALRTTTTVSAWLLLPNPAGSLSSCSPAGQVHAPVLPSQPKGLALICQHLRYNSARALLFHASLLMSWVRQAVRCPCSTWKSDNHKGWNGFK